MTCGQDEVPIRSYTRPLGGKEGRTKKGGKERTNNSRKRRNKFELNKDLKVNLTYAY